MSSGERDDWDAYWRGSADLGVFSQFADGGLLARFWEGVFDKHLAAAKPVKLLDLACGTGAVVTLAARIATSKPCTLSASALDYSPAAIAALNNANIGVEGVTGDAASTPFPDASFDLVVSQFGLEYAGPGAFQEAARLTASGGTFIAICHIKDGSIDQECRDHFDTIRTMIDSGFLPNAKAACNAAFAQDRGLGTPKTVQEANNRLAQSMASVKDLIAQKGIETADGLPARLFQDTGRIIQGRRAMDPKEIYTWFDGMSNELAAYAGRMEAMTKAALNKDDLEKASTLLRDGGLDGVQFTSLTFPGDAHPGAWHLEATRP